MSFDSSRLIKLRHPIRLDLAGTRVRVSHIEPDLLEAAQALATHGDPTVPSQIRCMMRVSRSSGEGHRGSFDLMAPHNCGEPEGCFLRRVLKGILHELIRRAEQRARAGKPPAEVSPWPCHPAEPRG